MKDRLSLLLQQPFAPLVPWVGFVLGLLLILSLVQKIGVAGAESKRETVEKEWILTRQLLTQHREARSARRDLNQVWSVLPDERDFAPLALGITEEAKRNRVTLPALSYKTEPTLVAHTSKGLLQGSMSGRYEDLRQFIYELETADELVFIEDLELAKSDGGQNQPLTFTIKIATYLRAESARPVEPEPEQ
jgi:Tfp pilus assembly protein PilO